MSSNITIKKINPLIETELDEFLFCSLAIYGNNARTKNSIAKTKKLVGMGRNHEFFIITDSRGTIGRMALGFNDRLCDANGVPYGQIGLFEVIEDYTVFSAMLDFAKKYLSGKNTILFPYYISTWHSYRFISKNDDVFHFFLEMNSKNYYSEYAKKYGVNDTYLYKSFRSPDLDYIINKYKPAYENALKEGFSFRTFDKSDPENEFKIIHKLSVEIFKNNHFYADISFDEFYELNKDTIALLDDEFVTLTLDKNKQPVGFNFSTPDCTPLVDRLDLTKSINKIRFYLRRKNAKGYIIKTFGIPPEYRRHYLISATMHMHAQVAKKRGYEYSIGALTFSGNSGIFGGKSTPSQFGTVDGEKDYELYILKN